MLRLKGWSTTILLIVSTAGVSGTLKAQALQNDTQNGDFSLEEVVVSAEKKSQDIQKVPSAVTAISGDELVSLGVANLGSLSNLIPSAKLNVDGSATDLFIRGIGSALDQAWISEAIGFNVNGSNSPRFTNGANFYDIASIEVVPGPQGTLYGANTSGGAINLSTNRPKNVFESSGALEVGNYRLVHGTGVINLPLTNDFYLRGAVDESQHSGYESNGADSQKSLGVRVSALYQPTNDVSAFLWGSYSSDTGRPAFAWYYPSPTKDAWTIPQHDPVALGPPFTPILGTDLDRVGFGNYKTRRLGGQLDMRFEGATLTYIPSYLTHSGSDQIPAAGFVQNRSDGYTQYTQELRLTSIPGGRLQWIGGLYWYQKQSTENEIFGPYLSGDIVEDHFRGEAAFWQATYSLTGAFRLTGGARYSRDELSTPEHIGLFPILSFAPSASPFNFDPAINTCQGLGIGIPCHFEEGRREISFDHTWSHSDWKVGAEVDLAENSMLYANVQTGYNEGTYDNSLSTLGKLINPQKLLAYTVGTKNRFFNNRLELNDEGYYYNYKDLILQYINAGNGTEELFNAPKSVIYGDDFRVAVLVTEGLKITSSIGYLHATIREFREGAANFAGYTLMNSPTWTSTVGIEQSWSLPASGRLSVRADGRYEGGFYGDFVHSPGLYIQHETRLDMSLMYRSLPGKWTAGLWAKNITNEARVQAASATGLPYPLAAAGFYDAPRTFGVKLRADY